MNSKEPKVRRLKGEDDEPKDERYDGVECFGSLQNIDLKVCQRCRKRKACAAKLLELEGPQDDEVEHEPAPAKQPRQDTIKIGKTDLHVTYRDTTFFLLGLLCGVVL